MAVENETPARGLGAEARDQADMPACGSTACISMPGMPASSSCVALAIATVWLGGLGEATRTSDWVMAISRGTFRSTSRPRSSRTSSPLLVGKRRSQSRIAIASGQQMKK